MGVGTRVYFLLHKQMLHIFFPNYMLWPISQIAMENYNHRFKVRLDQSPFLKFRQASNKYKTTEDSRPVVMLKMVQILFVCLRGNYSCYLLVY